MIGKVNIIPNDSKLQIIILFRLANKTLLCVNKFCTQLSNKKIIQYCSVWKFINEHTILNQWNENCFVIWWNFPVCRLIKSHMKFKNYIVPLIYIYDDYIAIVCHKVTTNKQKTIPKKKIKENQTKTSIKNLTICLEIKNLLLSIKKDWTFL